MNIRLLTNRTQRLRFTNLFLSVFGVCSDEAFRGVCRIKRSSIDYFNEHRRGVGAFLV